MSRKNRVKIGMAAFVLTIPPVPLSPAKEMTNPQIDQSSNL
jgi:hypothetical protein